MPCQSDHEIPPDQEVLYRLPVLQRVTGKGRASIYKDIAAGSFPAPIKIGRQSVAWRRSDIDRWIASRPTANVKQPMREVA